MIDNNTQPDRVTIETIRFGREAVFEPLAGHTPEFQALVVKMHKHRFTPVMEERDDGSVRMWTKERGPNRSREAANPTEAAKELSRYLRVALYQNATVEPDDAFEQQLLREGRDHDLDVPMRPNQAAMQEARRELYEPEISEDFERDNDLDIEPDR